VIAVRHGPVDARVVIVGAGPVGLSAAVGFAALGVESIVFERGTAEVAAEWRGSTLHPPTLEILEGLGLVDRAVAGGVRVDALQYRDLVIDEVVTIDLAVLAGHTRFPFRLQYEQYKLLRDLREVAARSPRIDVRYGHDVVGVDPGIDGRFAEVVVRSADGTDARVSTRWAIAADGSHSAVRDGLGVTMQGDTYAAVSLVVATDLPFGEIIRGLTPVSYWTGPHGRLSLIRTPDTWRVAMTVGADAPPLESAPDAVHPEFVRAMSLLIGDRAWTAISQHQTYRSHQRVAETFCVGRVMLVGDAAHLSATTGGMGLNSGLHDTHELVTAMAPAILAGAGEEAAAARVAESRRRVALQFIQPATRAARTSLDVTSEVDRRRRLDDLRTIAADPRLLTEHVLTASMLSTIGHAIRRNGEAHAATPWAIRR
jgi:3-(3-hydroxy-phenyl)propionate hydroxylase